MFQQRQLNEVLPLIEISQANAVSPGAITNGTTVAVTVTLKTGQLTTATFQLGDNCEVFAPASAALNGVLVSCAPTSTAGTALMYFTNNTGGTVTPVSATYTIYARRLAPYSVN